MSERSVPTAASTGHPSTSASGPADAREDDASHAVAAQTRPWWERIPGRLEYELQALDDAGIPYERDDDAFKTGVARLFIHPEIEGERLDLTVTFPDLYPFFRFSVDSARQLGLSHHQAPFGDGAICLIGRDTGEWNPSDTVAGLLQEKLPQVLMAGRSPDRALVDGLEEHQAEPLSDWYPYAPAMLQIDSAWRIPEGMRFGSFTARLAHPVKKTDDGHPLLRGVVTAIRGEKNEVIAAADPRLVGSAGPGEEVVGRWSWAPDGILTADAGEFYRAAAELDQGAKEPPPWPREPVRDGNVEHQLHVRGVAFPEEHAHRDASGQGWVFVVRAKSRRVGVGATSQFIKSRQRAPAFGGKWEDLYVFTRAGRAGSGDLSRRVPELAAVRNAKVAIVGLGCIGAPSAFEFARAQVQELRVMDGDVVDPATVSRWPLGLSAAGHLKVVAVRDAVRQDYPYTEVTPFLRKLGTPRAPSTGNGEDRVESDAELLERFADNVSLIYDASAESGVQYFLSEFARERGIPYIAVAGSYGGWGGRIVRVRPGLTEGCWACVQAARIDKTLPDPPADPNGRLQTEGCADPTFTGASFDLVSVAMHGVRLAISTLSAGAVGAYPESDWDVAVIAHRDPAGRPIAPAVQTFPLRRHPACPVCAGRTS